MTKTSTRWVAMGFCMTLLAATAGATGYAIAEQQKEKDFIPASELARTLDAPTSLSKDETVYVIAKADGSVKKIIVSDWIKNSLKAKQLSDETNLRDIQNVKNDQSYSINSDNMKLWDADGQDIYYQGNIDKELPVNLSVSYFLDGKAISAEELAGKSGKLTMRFDYENRQYEYVAIDGVKQRIYVPFAMLTGAIFDNDKFSNVQVTNGKLVNDGNRTLVVGLALPGLQENLNLSSEQFEIPSYVEISADVKEFELGLTATIATNELFNDIDETKINSVEDMLASLGQMDSAMSQLINGSSSLYDGMMALLEKSAKLVEAMNIIANGTKQLQSASVQLDDGVGQLQEGVSHLHAGLSELDSHSDQINDGAKQVFDNLLAMADQQLRILYPKMPTLTIENYAEVLNGIIAELDKDKIYQDIVNRVEAEAEKNRPYLEGVVREATRAELYAQISAEYKGKIKAGLTAEAREDILSSLVAERFGGMTLEGYQAAITAGKIDQAIQDEINALLEVEIARPERQAKIEVEANVALMEPALQKEIQAELSAKMQSTEIQALIKKNTEVQINKFISGLMSSELMNAGLELIDAGAERIISLKLSLDNYNTFYLGLQSYTDGVAQATAGAAALEEGSNTLRSGTEQIREGVASLYDGVLQVKDNMPALMDGVTKLGEGAMQLNDGLKLFNEQAVQKITRAAGKDLKRALAGFKASVAVSKDYRSFAGKSADMDGRVKFIYRTDEIRMK